jgi:hypothetical protein
MPFKDLPEGQTHSFLDPDWVSDCCGSELKQEMRGFTCSHCKKICQVKQLHDIKIETLNKKQYE